MSEEVIKRIEGDNYLKNKIKQNDYMWFRPYSAKNQWQETSNVATAKNTFINMNWVVSSLGIMY